MNNLKIKFQNFQNSLKRNGIKTEIRRLKNYIKFGKTVPNEYEEWITLNEPSKTKLEKQKKYISNLNTKFLLIVPNEKAKEKIGDQTYTNFEVAESVPKDYLDIIKKYDSDYCIFVGDNIELQDFALFTIQDFIEFNECNAVYSDNDYIVDGKRTKPCFKPHFAYNNILSKNYIGNFLVVKTKFLKQYPDILCNLNNDEPIYNIILRIIEKNNKIMHIDQCLYHILDEKINIASQKEVIKEYLDKTKKEYDKIQDGKFLGQYKIDYKIKGNPKISIVIPNMDHIEDLKKCIDSILKSTYQNYEIIIVENNSKQKETFEYYKKIENEKIKVKKLEINEFNFSKIVNYGVEQSSGKYIVLLNNDIEILNADWLEQMLMYVQDENVGICGARLYFNDDSIQHAGVTIGIRGLAGHRYREVKKEDFTEFDDISYVQDLSAVTAACFMVKKEDYINVLGFDEKLAVAFNDVDFCLKIRKKDKLIVYNPYVNAYHYESKSRGEDTQDAKKQQRFAREYSIFVKRWRHAIGKGDPYFNINYRLDTDIPKINYNKII